MIIIAPWARKLPEDKSQPKNYPWWPRVIELLGDSEPIIQVGVEGEKQLVPDFRKNLKLTELCELLQECRTWCSVDSFFQHLAWDLGKPGVVIWGQSDPIIFGHPENINLLKDRKYLREKQFWLWSQTPFKPEAFVTPEEVKTAILWFKSYQNLLPIMPTRTT
jgi:ADP-heptose:LPS heptosyltransferase